MVTLRARRSRKELVELPAGAGPALERVPRDPLPKPNSLATHGSVFMPPEQREALIREAAYMRAEKRGFCAGHELEDWLSAEADIDWKLANGEMPGLPHN